VQDKLGVDIPSVEDYRGIWDEPAGNYKAFTGRNILVSMD
jgi:hypothetical protein